LIDIRLTIIVQEATGK